MPRRRYTDDWPEYRPRLPADGIKAKSQRGDFGASWWSKRWISVLEGFGYGSRLTRGRTYARGGAVLSITINPGQVTAKVQGSRPSPYNVSISLTPLNDQQWEQAIAAMAEQAIFAASLLAGEMPRTIEEAFDAVKLPLFPRNSADLRTHCSCPDSANPCKHIAAVHYLLGERFDADPFLLFALRGRNQEQIGAALRSLRADNTIAELEAAPLVPAVVVPPLIELVAGFDEPGTDLGQLVPSISAPTLELALMRRMGSPPAGLEAALSAHYRRITQAALERLFTGEAEPRDSV